ncbi:MAG: ATP-binding cassette domain-containing protein [Clostridia bacterium]|nr:ATP-binding cassette domain-containing protein [Clostridia bacterium]
MIKFDSVSIQYVKEYFALYNFSTEIKNHTLFVGDDYVGSSAIMRLLAKIDNTYSGNIFIDEINIKTIKDKDLNVAYIPQIPYLFKHKSIEKNLAYPLNLRKFDKNHIKNTINIAFLNYNLKNFNEKISKMNLSEKKILTLIRASLWQPKYLLLENFFEDLNESYFELANKIIEDIKKNSIIIATEKESKNLKIFKDFKTVNLYK